MSTQVLEQHIVSTPGTLGGKPRIAGRRIAVVHIATWHEEMGMSADEIARDFDLTLGEVYAALSYYHDHKDEIDRREAESEAFVQELRAKNPSLVEQRLHD